MKLHGHVHKLTSFFFLPILSFTLHSQVCNLMWSKNVNELVSTHGYSLNQVIVWKYPSMQKIATLTGHTLRCVVMVFHAYFQYVRVFLGFV